MKYALDRRLVAILFGGPAAFALSCGEPGPCGNGILEPGERCDDGNTDSRDGCDVECRPEKPCGEFGLGDDALWCPMTEAELRCGLEAQARFFFNGSTATGDWASDVIGELSHGSHGTRTPVVWREGDSTFLVITSTASGETVLWTKHVFAPASWAPAADGPICRLAMAIAIRGNGSRVGMLIEQADALYATPRGVASDDTWIKWIGWTEANFTRISTQGPESPDMRAGSSMRFGFVIEDVWSPGDSPERSHRIDDWAVSLYPDL
ncbi:MAG: hypothetical protein HY791_34685 [Deltaproteobacteria bacterium]|nr:hypothetical protein [Deltaproteobacteria bacterium]